jgi:pentapeptide MXKDX repeat protein
MRSARRFFSGSRNKRGRCRVETQGGVSRFQRNQLSKGSLIMTTRSRLALIASAAVLSFGVALAPAAYAADDMKKDSMSKDTMSKDSMSKDSMKKDTMSKDTMSKDSMSKDSMKKDDGMKKN